MKEMGVYVIESPNVPEGFIDHPMQILSFWVRNMKNRDLTGHTKVFMKEIGTRYAAHLTLHPDLLLVCIRL